MSAASKTTSSDVGKAKSAAVSEAVKLLRERDEEESTNPIFRIPKKDWDFAEELDGKQLIEGAWYFQFRGKMDTEFMDRMTKKFRKPVGMEVVQHYKDQQEQKKLTSAMRTAMRSVGGGGGGRGRGRRGGQRRQRNNNN